MLAIYRSWIHDPRISLRMIELNPVGNDEPALLNAPMITAAEKVLSYLVTNNSIGLTRTKAFQRKFVHWAADEFAWPGMETERLFKVNKVLNEYDFPPLEALHFVLLKLKLIRHYKLECRLTKLGRDLAHRPGDLFNMIAPFYLFEIDHAASSRIPEPLFGNWHVVLGVLNVEGATSVTCGRLREVLYGPPDADDTYDRVPGMIWGQVLRPLCWLGLLQEINEDERQWLSDRTYKTTALWSRTFSFSRHQPPP